jgi:branched-chain amino acid aminotransferase
MYIRPLLFGSSAQLGLNPPEEYTFLVYVLPTGVYHGTHPVAALILEDFDRAAPNGTGSAKIGGNYAPVLRWSDKAREEGFGITLHLDSATRTEIDEFSTSGFIGVKGDAGEEGEEVTIVVPDSTKVIKSVTSNSVCDIASKTFGWKVERRSVCYSTLANGSLLMLMLVDQIRRPPLLHGGSGGRNSSCIGTDQVDYYAE